MQLISAIDTETMFEQLPNVLVVQFLKDWLVLEDICTFDTAICNKAERRIYIHYCNIIPLVKPGYETYLCDEVFINWLEYRNIAVKQLNLKISNSFACRQTQNLRQFSFASKLQSLTVHGICQYNLAVLCRITSASSNLLKLHIFGSRFVTDQFVVDMTIYCPLLTSLGLTRCSEVTDNTFIRVSEQCRGITELSLTGCNSVSEGSIQLMLSNCRIQRVTLFECPQMSLATVKLIAHRCHSSLLELHLSQIAVQLVDLAALCALSPSLEALSLRSAGILSAYCPQYPNLGALRSLDVSGNGAMSNVVLTNLMHDVDRQSLRSLSVANCSLLDGEFVDYLVTQYKGLQELDVSQCSALSDKVVVTAVKHLPALKILNVSGNFKLNKQTLNAICQHAHSLESLNVSHCPNVQLFGVLRVLDACPLLRRIDVTGCKNVEGLKVKHHVANQGLRCVVIAGSEFTR